MNKDFLKSLGLFEKRQGFLSKRYWCFQSSHWPHTHISMLEANWLESLDEEMIKKVIGREGSSGYKICTMRALQND